MQPHRLAVRPAPYPGESLLSYAGRLADVNHLSVSALMGDYYAPTKYRYGDPNVIEALHAVSGVEPDQLQQMAHPVVAGSAGSRKGFLGIRTHGAVICHNCHGDDGIRMLEWDHPLVLICLYCGETLAPIDAPQHRFTAGRDLRFALEDVRENALDTDYAPARKRIELLAKMGRTVARSMTASWPRTHFKDVREAATRAHAELGERPSRREVASPPSRDLALVVIATCWDHTVDEERAFKWLKSRIRSDRTQAQRRRRSIEVGRGQVEAWTRRLG